MMSSGFKKLLNDNSKCVDECLFGLTSAHPHLAFHPRHRVVIDADVSPNRKVGIVSGGGSGHEPFPAGYVGAGMLTAAVCGSVFASPPSTHILYAIREVSKTSPGGVLVLIPNYTGDRLNFGLAVETAKAEGLQVDSYVVGDDIAQCVDGGPSPGRRGMVGIVAVFKIAGHEAFLGGSLQAVKEAAASVAGDSASLGVALSGGTLPGASQPLFQLAADEIELGVGVHGEAGIQTIKICSAQKVVELTLNHLTKYLRLSSGNKVIVLVNNLGALSQLEQWLVAGEIQEELLGALEL